MRPRLANDGRRNAECGDACLDMGGVKWGMALRRLSDASGLMYVGCKDGDGRGESDEEVWGKWAAGLGEVGRGGWWTADLSWRGPRIECQESA